MKNTAAIPSIFRSFATCAVLAFASGVGVEPRDLLSRPNIVLLVIDDATPTDLGAYGSEIATPTIDRLAARGARFTRFRASPMCAPSRAMLLTGVDSHTAGIANLPESVPDSHEGKPGYLGRLADNVVTVAQLLQRSGYRTYAAGKWHLGGTPGSLPPARGFDRSVVVDATGADNWEQRPYLPIYDDAHWLEDGKPIRLPVDFYSSAYLVDRMIEYIGGQQGDQPFFAYLPMLAIHIPVQAPREFTERYADTYTAGWAAQATRRHAAAIRAGLVPADAATRPPLPRLRDWNALDAPARAAAARAMAVNAGMLTAMDHHFGRLVTHLERIGAYDNTLFVVLADNGSEPNDPAAGLGRWLRTVGYSTDPARLGERGSFVAIGPEAAKAATMPFALFKFNAAEGGVRVPLIVAGPGVRAGTRVDATSFVTDIVPTLLEATGTPAAPPPAPAPIGKSLGPLLRGEASAAYGVDEPIVMEAAGVVALYRGDVKLVRDLPPYGDAAWHLYDIVRDPGETNDLAAAQPALLASLRAEYDRYAARVGVLEVPTDYGAVKETGAKILRALTSTNAPAKATNVTGEWAFTVTTERGAGTPTLIFKQDGEKLTGKFNGQLGAADLTGTVKGNAIYFAFTLDLQGQQAPVTYDGTIEKNTMKGTFDIGGQVSGTFTASKR